MLVTARESRGLTQSQLVDKVPNLNQGNYSKMEKGLLSVPIETILNIADVLYYKPSFFFKESVNTPISSFYYRKRVSMAKKELSILESKLDIVRTFVDELLESVDIPDFKVPFFDVDENITASDIAIKVRDFFRIPKGPINNIIEVLESNGIIIYFFKTTSQKFDGITLLTDKGQPIIFVNESMPNERKIFTIAHELGHLVMHIPFSPLPSFRDEEKEANEFAGEFLMPYLDCRNDLRDLRYSQLGILKSYWKVSKAAIVYRANAIGAIFEDRYRNLNIELSKNGEKKKESGFVDVSEPKLMSMIVNVHEQGLQYSIDEMLDLLGIMEQDYFEYFSRSIYNKLVQPKKVINISSFLKAT